MNTQILIGFENDDLTINTGGFKVQEFTRYGHEKPTSSATVFSSSKTFEGRLAFLQECRAKHIDEVTAGWLYTVDDVWIQIYP